MKSARNCKTTTDSPMKDKLNDEADKVAQSTSINDKAVKGLSCWKSRTYARKVSNQKATGKNKRKFDELALTSVTPLLSPKAPIITTGSQQTLPVVVAPMGLQSPLLFRKFQLQLFPIDDATRKGLEEDNYHPYLELTVANRKKISSVIKHLNFKWGNSYRASTDLMLFPYDARVENLASYRKWTLNDYDVTTSDVYDVLGRPAIFRLRYGWFSSINAGCSYLSSTSHSLINFVEYPNKNVADLDKQASTLMQECERLSTEPPQKRSDCATSTDEPNQPAENLKSGNNAMLSLVDCLSNISFGALYSKIEEEVEGAKHSHQLGSEKNINPQYLPISCDSFDAAIAAHISRYQPTNHSTKMPQSSILDAEDTCNPFSFHNFTSSNNQAQSGDPSISPSSQKLESDIVSLSNALSPTLERDDTHLADVLLTNERDQSEEVKVDTNMKNNHFKGLDMLWPPPIGPCEVATSSRLMISSDSNGLTGSVSNFCDIS
ncbi:TSL-kinase interacting protein 1 [Apostasia shenzhenica]|uniref:TSL-kinase interacting protein 1 n=1 Tax=Apostasia shenzhenica TaxID=1088818 RepID=A0A2I0B9P4_9ASPA|nr:TSL-kinase interacting protein 1 [Apostasia shenzhenica]